MSELGHRISIVKEKAEEFHADLITFHDFYNGFLMPFLIDKRKYKNELGENNLTSLDHYFTNIQDKYKAYTDSEEIGFKEEIRKELSLSKMVVRQIVRKLEDINDALVSEKSITSYKSRDQDRNGQIFISYSPKDIKPALRIFKELKANRLVPWMDSREKEKDSEEWKMLIKQSIQDSQYFIPLWSTESVEDQRYIQRELKVALEALSELAHGEITVIPMRLNDCQIPYPKEEGSPSIDMFPDWDDGIRKLFTLLSSNDISRERSGVVILTEGAELAYSNLEEVYWNNLLKFVNEKKCIPFVGSGAYLFAEGEEQWIPRAGKLAKDMIEDEENSKYFHDFDLAKDWIEEREQSFLVDDTYQLARVAQFLAIESMNEKFPKLQLSQYLGEIDAPDFTSEQYENTAYAVLADLDLPFYVTTNYDFFLEKALEDRSKGAKKPVSGICRWKHELNIKQKTIEYGKKYEPSVLEPFVYHLHGHIEKPESMVLTERDYFDFISYFHKEKADDIYPPFVSRKLSSSSLLFIGYNLHDITFRTIFQGALSSLDGRIESTNVAVQLPPTGGNYRMNRVIKYFNQYTMKMFDVQAYWGNVSDFARDFRNRIGILERPKSANSVR